MSTGALHLPRRLAIRLLAEAQRAGGAVRGRIGARGGVAVSVHPDADELPAGETLWAEYRSAALPPAAGRELVISVDTKGVLQLRCLEGGAERELDIRD